MTQQITVVAQGGLCNRLRVVLSALLFAEESNTPVTVDWAKNTECYAHFDELFESLNNEKFKIVAMRWWNLPVERKNLHLPALIRLPLYRKQIKNYHPSRHPSLFELTARYHNLYLSTGYSLIPYPQQIAQRLQPNQELQQRILEITKHFGEKMVGVHIRRTDNMVSIAESPIERFVEAMEYELKYAPTVNFYVATDDISIRNLLIQRFPNRIHYQHLKECSRTTVDGIKDAIVDLYCLSKTQKIIGSYWSSFSDTAAEIGDIPLHIVRKSKNNTTQQPQ